MERQQDTNIVYNSFRSTYLNSNANRMYKLWLGAYRKLMGNRKMFMLLRSLELSFVSLHIYVVSLVSFPRSS